MTERYIEGMFVAEMMKQGAESYVQAFAPMVATGEKNSYISMCRNTLRQIKESEILNLAAGVCYEGYNGIICSPLVLGEIPQKIKDAVMCAYDALNFASAKMKPGDSGQVKVVGAWKPSQTLKVTCPNKVTLTYEDQTLDVGITFAGIEQAGSLLDEFNISKDISVENKAVMFGTWTGKLEYTVEFIDAQPNIINFTIEDVPYQAEEGMTWLQWIDSDYNTGNFLIDEYGDVRTEDGWIINHASAESVIIEGTDYFEAEQ
jgi:hypothetical protein